MSLKNLSELGYPNYAVNEYGDVFSFTAKRFLKTNISSSTGRCRVNLYDGQSNAKTVEVHRLVALMFLDNPNNYNTVNHIDGNILNNHVSNLEWCTSEYNSIHAARTGLSKVRSLDEQTVINVLSMMEEGYRNKGISDICGISYHVICKIRQGENYRDLWVNFNIPSKKSSVSLNTVLRIKEMLKDGLPTDKIIKELNISRSLVKDIRDGKRFKNIKLERATTIENTEQSSGSE